MSHHRGTAVPLHTIIRYAANEPGGWAGWRPVTPVRWRLFVNATHEEVTGEKVKGGAHWDHDWACEELVFAPDGTSYWSCTGRNEWPTLEIAQAAVANRSFATFAEALAKAGDRVRVQLRSLERQVDETQRMLDVVAGTIAPVLP